MLEIVSGYVNVLATYIGSIQLYTGFTLASLITSLVILALIINLIANK